MIKLFVNCFLLLCNSLLSTSKEITEQKSLSIVLYGMKHQLEEIKEYQTKQDIRIHDLEQDKLNRNLEYDMLIRKLEKNNAIREQEQNNRIHELESDNRILKQEQNNRIRKFECDNRILKQKQNNRILKLEHDIRIQNIHIEALNSKYIHSENVKPIVKVNDAMTLYKQNMTTLETTEDNLKLTAKEAIPVNVTKHLNDRRCGKDGIAGRCHRKRLLLSIN
ncbi:unnamed protein product [Mytilus edulis]|uniref:Uncharacterized protein n=1 Tax=Mytilus edulis TaxID=6550 RepID=A0A8S3RRB9_MYTED|nr:unnamed protein product [Mytilus edulis]